MKSICLFYHQVHEFQKNVSCALVFVDLTSYYDNFLLILCIDFNHTEGLLNDQFSQLGFNGSSMSPVQNNNFVSWDFIIIHI